MSALHLAAMLSLCHPAAAPGLPELAAEVELAERRHHLPGLLLAAVVIAESGCRVRLVTVRRCGLDVGAGQVHLHKPVSRARLQLLLTLSVNLDRAGALLAGSRETCRWHPGWRACKVSEWSLYNAGAAPRWWARVARLWWRLRGREGEA